MKKTIIYGAGVNGKLAAESIKHKNAFDKFADVLAFADRDQNLWGRDICGIKVISPDDIVSYAYDEIVVTVGGDTDALIVQLVDNYGVIREKITPNYFDTFDTLYAASLRFLASQSNIIRSREIQGAVAECGVWKGGFAKYINHCFPDRTLYLFDTFCGFSEHDVEIDKKNNVGGKRDTSYFFDTSEEYVRSKLPYPDKAEFRVGRFPETAVGLEGERFAFVRLDMDLYQPTLDGLNFFYPLMSRGGLVMVHDYFDYFGWTGVKKAVDEFCAENGTGIISVGDKLSVSIIKQ